MIGFVAGRVEPGELFLPELASGADALEAADRTRIQSYLCEVVVQRMMPLSGPSLWNALYFGWDLDERGYVQVPTAFAERLALIENDSRHPALPVGALVRVAWGGAEFWAEVTHKDGARPEVDSGWLAGAQSGEPAHAGEDGAAVLRERLVLDPAVFGRELAPTPVQLERLRRRGRWLDARGHLIVDALYASAEEADLGDTSFFARWLWENHRQVLAEGRLRACLGQEATEEDLLDALLASIVAVEELAAGAPGLCRWRSHYFPAADYAARLADPEDPFGAEGIERLLRGLLRPPGSQRICFGALGPRLAELEQRAELTGIGYSRAVCHASLRISERLAELAPDGRTAAGVHLRLDDAWQQGGIWRAEAMEERGALCDLGPTIALGLGWAESQGLSDLVGAAVPDLADEDPGEPEPEILQFERQTAVFRVELAARQIEGGLLRLPTEMADLLEQTLLDQGHRALQLTLELPGRTVQAEVARQAVVLDQPGRHLGGIEWAFDVHVGLQLLVSWRIGATVLEARARLREAPLELAGHLYLWECDERALARSLGLAERPRRAGSLRELILQVLRRRGRPGPDGSRRGARGPITTAIFGPSPAGGARAAVRLELDLMAREGTLTREGPEFVLTPRVLRPHRPPDLGALRDYLAATRERRETLTRRHTVVLFLRRLRDGHQASADKQRNFAREVAEQGLQHQLGETLPAGYTYVSTHERGYADPGAPDPLRASGSGLADSDRTADAGRNL